MGNDGEVWAALRSADTVGKKKKFLKSKPKHLFQFIVKNFYYNITPKAPPMRKYDEVTRAQAPRNNH